MKQSRRYLGVAGIGHAIGHTLLYLDHSARCLNWSAIRHTAWPILLLKCLEIPEAATKVFAAKDAEGAAQEVDRQFAEAVVRPLAQHRGHIQPFVTA